jgi:SulP family sulfate permease
MNSDNFSVSYLRNEITSYNLDALKSDLRAGLEVALLTVPQAMAYALVAGLPTSTGLFAAVFSAIMAALMGSSRYLIVGPVNAIAILVQAGTADILYSYYRDATALERDILALEIMTQIALMAGILQLIVAVFKLGRLTQFVSHSVVIGYLAGGALAIITNQLFTFAGVPELQGVNSLYEKLAYFASHLELMNIPTFAIGLASLGILLGVKKIGKRLPAAAIMLAISGAFCFIMTLTSLASYFEPIALIGSTSDFFEMLPLFSWPHFNLGIMNHMIAVAFAVALLSIIETTCSAKSIAATSGQGIAINQEILSVGAANLVSSCTGSMPVSVSNSRSQLNLQSGAQTRFAAIFNAMMVATIVGYLGTFVNLIPLPALSALLFVTAFTLVNPKQLLLCIKSTSSDAFVLISTFLACVFFSLDTAFYIGVVLSISLYLKKAAMPQLMEYEIQDNGELRRLHMSEVYLQKLIRVIKVEGELFFGSADIFYTTLKTLAEDDMTTRVILLQLKNARDIDATSCLALIQLHEYLEKAGRYLVLSGMTLEMWDVMSNSGLIAIIGKDNLFIFDERYPSQYMQKAIARAKKLAQEPPKNPVKTIPNIPLETAPEATT